MATEPIAGDLGGIYHADTDDEQTGSGTIATTGTSVTGTTTAFDTEFPNFDTTQPTFIVAVLPDGKTEARLVTAVASATACTIGTAFTTDIAAGSSFTYVETNQIPFVIDITGPDAARAEIDTSSLGTGVYDEFIAGSINPGTVAFPLHYVPENAEHQEILARFDSGVILPYIAFFKSATTPADIPDLTNGRIYFRSYVANAPLTMARNDSVKLNMTLRVVGKRIFEGGT